LKLKQMIVIPVLALLLVSTVATTVINYVIAKNTVDEMVDNIVDSGVETLNSQLNRFGALEKDVLDEVNDKNLGLSRAYAEIIRLNADLGTLQVSNPAFNQRIAGILGVTEVHIIDGNGVLIGGNVADYYGLDFNTNDQTRPFCKILDDPTYELVQDPQPNAAGSGMFQYIGVTRTDEKGIVQIGHAAQSVQSFRKTLDISNAAADIHVGSEGRASILSGGTITYSQKTEKIGQDVSGEAWYKQVSSGRGKAWINLDGEKLYAAYDNSGDTTILVMFTKNEYDGYLAPVRNAGIIGSAVSLLIMLALVFFVAGRIVKPINEATAKLELVAAGDFSVSMTSNKQDAEEIHSLARSFSHLTENFKKQTKVMEAISDGDYTVTANIRSDKDVMNKAINHMLDSTNRTLNEIGDISNKVAMGAQQIADEAQSLANGSTMQASTIEKLSASITEIAQKTRDNSNLAKDAAVMADGIMKNAAESNTQMSRMIEAVDEINNANQSIRQVIKVIDDIAFQTNILALNAAVEAARAGQHGKGFAVVAEEVRNLAAKSAESAKTTGELITNSLEKAKLGTKIANETAESLNKIVSQINESNKINAQIAGSSDEQSRAIEEINSAIYGVTQVVQQNSATAEESAAASLEMSGQVATLDELISQFKLK